MGTVCVKCGHERQPSAPPPDYECPGCGVIYAKADSRTPKARKEAAASATMKVNWQQARQPKPKGKGAGTKIAFLLLIAFALFVGLRQAGVIPTAPPSPADEEVAEAEEAAEPSDDDLTTDEYAEMRMEVNCIVEGSRHMGGIRCIFLNTGTIEVSQVTVSLPGTTEQVDTFKSDIEILREHDFQRYTFILDGPYIPGKKKGHMIDYPKEVTTMMARGEIVDLEW